MYDSRMLKSGFYKNKTKRLTSLVPRLFRGEGKTVWPLWASFLGSCRNVCSSYQTAKMVYDITNGHIWPGNEATVQKSAEK